MHPMDEYLSSARSTKRFIALLSASFAGTGVALSFVGFFWIDVLPVRARRYEFGVRLALGVRSQPDSVSGSWGGLWTRHGRITAGLQRCGYCRAAVGGRTLRSDILRSANISARHFDCLRGGIDCLLASRPKSLRVQSCRGHARGVRLRFQPGRQPHHLGALPLSREGLLTRQKLLVIFSLE
jgi:hypothetical protein